MAGPQLPHREPPPLPAAATQQPWWPCRGSRPAGCDWLPSVSNAGTVHTTRRASLSGVMLSVRAARTLSRTGAPEPTATDGRTPSDRCRSSAAGSLAGLLPERYQAHTFVAGGAVPAARPTARLPGRGPATMKYPENPCSQADTRDCNRGRPWPKTWIYHTRNGQILSPPDCMAPPRHHRAFASTHPFRL